MVLGRIDLPRLVRIAWLRSSLGLREGSSRSIFADVSTSGSPTSPPPRMRLTSSSTSRLAPATCSASPSRLISLPRTCTRTSGNCFSTVLSSRSCGPNSRTIAIPSTLSSSWASTPPVASVAPLASETAKSAFFHALVVGTRTEHVGVNVKHCLPRARALVEHEPKLPTRVPLGEAAGRGDELREQCGVRRTQFGDVAVLTRLREHEEVHGGLRLNVADRNDAVVLEDNVGGDLARHDSLENARLCCAGHGPHRTGCHRTPYQRPSAGARAASAAGPAVLVRSTVSPRRLRLAPAASNAANSLGAMPPSGPTMMRMSRTPALTAVRRCVAAGSSTYVSNWLTSSASRFVVTCSCRRGTWARTDCFDASCRIAAQRSACLRAFAPSHFTIERPAAHGTTPSTPSSVAIWMASSSRSFFARAC